MALVMNAGSGPKLSGWRLATWAAIAVLLLVPAIAMRFTDAVAWTAGDFAAAAVLLSGAVLLFEGAVRLIGSTAGRVAAGLGILVLLVLVWLQLAVQII